MKKTVLFTLFFLWLTSNILAQVRPDEVQLDYRVLEKELSEVLVELSLATKVNIPFSNNIVPSDYLVTANYKNEQLGKILDGILKDTQLSFKLVGDQIVIIKDEYKNAPDFITIFGKVSDKESGEPLAYCDVYSETANKYGTTNQYGYYKMTIPSGLHRVYFKYLAYEYRVVEFKAKKDTMLNMQMKPKALLNEVLILDKNVDQHSPSDQRISQFALDKLQSIASLGGEADLASLALLSAGITSGADGVGGLNVRGGSADQNLTLLDGTPIYGFGHALGVFSNFNPNIMRSATLHKGSIPARYNGRLSSVLNVELRDGNMTKTKGDVSLGAIALKASIEGPMAKGKSSYLFSIRRSILDLWVQNASQSINQLNDREGSTDFFFYDLNAKLKFKLSDKHQLLLSYYRGKDFMDNRVEEIISDNGLISEELSEDTWQWSNNVVSARLNSKFGDRLFGKMNLYYTDFDMSIFDYQRFIFTNNNIEDVFYTAGRYHSNLADIGIKYDVDYLANDDNYLRVGFSLTRHSFGPGVLRVNEGDQVVSEGDEVTNQLLKSILKEDQLEANELDIYLEDEISIGNKTYLNIGIVGNAIATDGKTYLNILPRLSLSHRGTSFSYHMGLSRMSQYLHMISNTALGLPNNVWLPSTSKLQPESSWIVDGSLGVLTDGGLGLTVGGYFKSMGALISSSEGGVNSIGEDVSWDLATAQGDGKAYGVEINIDKRFGNFTWFFNYTYSRSTRQFDLINRAQDFDFQYDRRHQYKFAVIQKINKNAELSLNWQYGTGNPVTAPLELFPFIDDNGVARLLPLYDAKNNTQFPDYHRLDFVFSFYNNFDWARQKISLGLYNAYNRKNPFFIDLRQRDAVAQSPSLFQYSLLPILPVLNYSLSF